METDRRTNSKASPATSDIFTCSISITVMAFSSSPVTCCIKNELKLNERTRNTYQHECIDIQSQRANDEAFHQFQFHEHSTKLSKLFNFQTKCEVRAIPEEFQSLQDVHNTHNCLLFLSHRGSEDTLSIRINHQIKKQKR